MAKRILIAEDEKSAREALANLATMQGYDVTTVTNGVDLLAIASHERFDVVITDLLMKDLNGASAVRNHENARTHYSSNCYNGSLCP